MSAKATHPLYDKMRSVWELSQDCYDGEPAIKSRGVRYLPATGGQIEDGQGKGADQLGQRAYDAYNTRAVYPDLYRGSVETAIGMMHRNPPTIELPASMDNLREDCTYLGESLEMLLRRINVNQLISGRVGILGDIRVNGAVAKPVISVYSSLAIRNWQDAASDADSASPGFVVLDESGYAMGEDFSWDYKERYRVVALVTKGEEGTTVGVGGSTYGTALLEGDGDIRGAEFITPNLSGSTLASLPFTFINSRDISPSPDLPPQLGLANLCLAIYRGEADYRQSLFLQGQDTLVRIGVPHDSDDQVRTGAGARIDVPIGGDAKYIGVDSSGLPEQRQSLENDYLRAADLAGKLQNATSNAKESGDALRIRISAQTATLPQIAQAGAAGLERVLRSMAEWYGAKQEDIVVTPNLDFIDDELNGATLVDLQSAKNLGTPIADESIHAWMVEHGATKLTYEEELAKIESEVPRL